MTELGKAGFAAPTGTEGTVGLVGATLGGGFGLLTRNFGMASDNLIAAEVVVASNGEEPSQSSPMRRTTRTAVGAPWAPATAISAIVTSLTYKIHPLTQAISVTATWPGLGELHAVFEAWQRRRPTPTTGSPASSR